MARWMVAIELPFICEILACVGVCICVLMHINNIMYLCYYFQIFVCVIKGAQIGPSLKNLAERRTDIFGSEETVIGRKVHTYIQYEVYMHV